VANEFEPATSVEEKSCLQNCQSKTYKAFDLYMAVSERVEARKNFRSVVDISRYTGMEVEHKHDTASVIPHKGDGHVHPASLQEFQKNVEQNFGLMQKKAIQ
jgi:hypothetical protein